MACPYSSFFCFHFREQIHSGKRYSNMFKRKKAVKIIGIIICLFAAFIVLAISFLPQARIGVLLLLSPKQFKKACFHKLVKDDQNIYMLGTIHGRHFKTRDYSLLQLRAVIMNLRPDLLLVESRQDELYLGNLADGPIEMLYSNLTARSLGIEVKGIDWWSPKTNKPNSTNPERDDNIVKNILRESKGRKKVLLLIGFIHIFEAIPRLKKAGFAEAVFPNEEKEKLFEVEEGKFLFPKGMRYYIERRIAREKELIGTTYVDEKWIKAVRKLITRLEYYLKKIQDTGEYQ